MSISNLITDSEWQIMRSIWARVPITSSELFEELNKTTGWTSATIKTLLTRLVKKEVISFELQGRTRLYFPLFSEEECIKDEMKSVIDKFYGGQINLETKHFIFKGDKDTNYIALLAERLEASYDQIAQDLGYTIHDKLLVFTHISQKRLHSALGLLEGPNWLRAGFTWGILHIAPRVCFNDLPAEKAAVHTMTQIMINTINPSVPYWLQQAVCTYEGKWLTKERIKQGVKEFSEKSNLPIMTDRTKDYHVFKESGSYELAYTVAEFIVTEYGMKALSELLRKPSDYIGVLTVSEEQFWKNWQRFLAKNYR